jgi:hypothetical protein
MSSGVETSLIAEDELCFLVWDNSIPKISGKLHFSRFINLFKSAKCDALIAALEAMQS